MYAIVDIAGQQFKVEKDQKIYVNRLEGKEGSKVDFDQVLLVDNDGKVTVGTPVVKDMVVSASIVSHVKSDKVLVFRKKRRKGFKKLNGHRQAMTELLIEGIGAGKAKKTEPKAETKAPKTEATKAAADTAEKKAPKKAAASASDKKSEEKPKAAAKKPAAKSTSAKSSATKKPAAKKATTAKKTTAAKSAEPKAKKTAAPKKSDDKAKEDK